MASHRRQSHPQRVQCPLGQQALFGKEKGIGRFQLCLEFVYPELRSLERGIYPTARGGVGEIGLAGLEAVAMGVVG